MKYKSDAEYKEMLRLAPKTHSTLFRKIADLHAKHGHENLARFALNAAIKLDQIAIAKGIGTGEYDGGCRSGAAFLDNHCGIEDKTEKNTVAYLQG